MSGAGESGSENFAKGRLPESPAPYANANMGHFEEDFAMYSMRYIEMISRESTRLNARRTAEIGPMLSCGQPLNVDLP
jgi:hypothetical protein